jgi:small subunit ribosomal protein S1
MSSTDEKDESPGESFGALFEQQAAPAGRAGRARVRAPRVGDRLEGVVVRVGRESVFLELDGKRQAFIDAAELRGEDGTMTVAEGDRVGATVVEVDERQGIVRLGRSMGHAGGVSGLLSAREAQLPVEGRVTGVNKGGLDVEIGGVRAFCPTSQASNKFLEDASTLVGQTLRFLVTDVRDGGKNVVVSRRALLERDAGENAARAMADVVPGAILRGTVTSVRDFGAFVDLGGVEGLIPRSEVAHDRNVSVADALKPGDAVEVAVREVKDAEPARRGGPTKKITLSLKALAADPWAGLDLVPGRVVVGVVTRATEFGRFVQLAPGVEGLLHVSELGKSDTAHEGEEIRVVVKKLDREAKKISLVQAPEGAAAGATLAVPATGPNVTVGAVVRGTVERIETYGVFVQLEGTKGRAGRGLVPNAELGVPRGTDLRKAFPEGTAVSARVMETGEGRLRLSIKGAKDAEERAVFEEAKRNATASAGKSLGTFADLLKNKKR